jgi:hypothetical protein
MRRFAFHILLFLAIAVATFCVRNVFASRYAKERHQIYQNSRAERDRKLVSDWNSLGYASLESCLTNSLLLTNHQIAKLPLSPLQRTRFESILLKTVGYLIEPSFDKYYRLKTENLQWGFKSRAGASETNVTIIAQNSWNSLAYPEAAKHTRLTEIELQYLKAELVSTNDGSWPTKGKLARGLIKLKSPMNPGFTYETNANATSFFALKFLCSVGSFSGSWPGIPRFRMVGSFPKLDSA